MSMMTHSNNEKPSQNNRRGGLCHRKLDVRAAIVNSFAFENRARMVRKENGIGVD